VTTARPRHRVLAGSWAKIDRAHRHRAELDRAIAEWLDSKPYTLRTEPDGAPDHYVIRLDGLPRVPLAIGAIVGDTIHNLRSALDHLVYRIAIIESRRDPPPKASKLAFPIALSAEAFGRKAASCRGALSDTAWDALRQFQPFTSHPANPRASALSFLEELDIADKHREFRLMLTQLGTLLKVEPTGPGVGITGLAAPGVLEADAPLIWFESKNPGVTMNFYPSLTVSLVDRELLPKGQPVTTTLDILIANVEKVVGAWIIKSAPKG